MYTALLQVIIYQLAKYERDPMEKVREIAERSKWKRKKIIKNNKEKDNTTTERSSDVVGRP